MDFSKMTLKERANHCLHIYKEGGEGETPRCSDNFNDNQRCGYICCGHCPDYAACEERCRLVWIDPLRLTGDPRGRLYYIVLETGELVAGSIPCLISDMYDDNR